VNFDQAFDRLMGHEGSYSNNPMDPGGETMWGITQRVARTNGYTGDMRSLTREKAKEIAKAAYWTPCRADDMPDVFKFDVFDGAYNSGVSQSIKWLQRAVGATDDGQIGPATIAAAQSATPLAIARYNGQRLQFMTDLGTFGQFGKGWARRIAANLSALGA
jgi:lysozyme family protein